MGYPVEECNPDELLTDGDFDKAPGAWTVGAQWTIDGLGKAVFGGPSAVETKISQTIDIVEDHLLEIKMTVDSVFWLFPPKSFQLKIGGASSPALTIAKPYVFYLLPSLSALSYSRLQPTHPLMIYPILSSFRTSLALMLFVWSVKMISLCPNPMCSMITLYYPMNVSC